MRVHIYKEVEGVSRFLVVAPGRLNLAPIAVQGKDKTLVWADLENVINEVHNREVPPKDVP